LDTVLCQTLHPYEIIVVDNCSQDGTCEMIDKFYPSVKLLVQGQKGVSATRNMGIKESLGNWVAFLDSDDQWHKKKLEIQVQSILSDNNRALLSHTDELWFRNNQILNQKTKHKKRGGFIFDFCLPLCCISPSSTLIKKKVFQEIGVFDESLEVCEDYDFWLRYCLKHPVNFVNKQLTYKYGGHPDQLSRKNWGMDRFRVASLEKLVNKNLLEKTQAEKIIKTLLQKLEIIIQGAKNRSNKEIYNKYMAKKAYWLDRIENAEEL
jgi:glycosyltransferase involved in cell wall biosynthesis